MAVNIVNITTLNRVRLYSGQPGTTGSTLYTVPSGTDVKVSEVVITNTMGASATVSLYVVPSGQTYGAANSILTNLVVAANAVVVMDMSVYMTSGDFLAAVQSTANAVTLTISGETYA